MNRGYGLFKSADNEEKEPIYEGLPYTSHAQYTGPIGAAMGTLTGAQTGAFLGPGIAQSKYFRHLDVPTGKARIAGSVPGALIGLGIGQSIGAGVGGLRDYGDMVKANYQKGLNERKEYLRENIKKEAAFKDDLYNFTGMNIRKAKQNFNKMNEQTIFDNADAAEDFRSSLNQARNDIDSETSATRSVRKELGPPLVGLGAYTGLIGGGIYAQSKIDENLRNEIEEEGRKRQGAGSVSNAPAGADKTASYSPLFKPLEKSAGPINFAELIRYKC